MRRAAHLVAPILIVLTTLGPSYAFGQVMRFRATTAPGGIVDVLHSTPIAEIANGAARGHITSAAELKRSESIATSTSSVELASPGSAAGGYETPVSASRHRSFEPEDTHGRAPPLSR